MSSNVINVIFTMGSKENLGTSPLTFINQTTDNLKALEDTISTIYSTADPQTWNQTTQASLKQQYENYLKMTSTPPITLTLSPNISQTLYVVGVPSSLLYNGNKIFRSLSYTPPGSLPSSVTLNHTPMNYNVRTSNNHQTCICGAIILTFSTTAKGFTETTLTFNWQYGDPHEGSNQIIVKPP